VIEALIGANPVWMMITEYPLHRNNGARVLPDNHTEFIKTKRHQRT